MSASTSQAPLHLLSTEQMPFAPRTAPRAHVAWHGSDSEERYRERPHPTLGPADVEYRFNAHGYRCREFDAARDSGAITVVALGASEVMGTGVPQEQTFAAVFARLLGQRLGRPAIDWNLGVGGSSADYIARTLVSALPVLKPDVVLMVFPHQGRRELLAHDGRIHYYKHEAGMRRKLGERFLDPERYVLTQASMNLSSEFNDTMSQYKNYKVCEALCQQHGAMWLFSATRDACMAQIAHLVDHAHWVRPGLADLKSSGGHDEGLALARDMQHPGIGPHRELAERMFERLQACHGDRLRPLERVAAAA
jgi:hypothetical protein